MNFFKNKTYLNFIIYFVFYGAIIAIITSTINYNLQYSDIEKDVNKRANYVLDEKSNEIKNYIRNIEQNLYSIIQNPIFIDYLNRMDDKTIHFVENLFLNTSMSNKNFFQVRFLGLDGKELIRIDKDKVTNNSFIVGKQNLQDKSNRYYFQDTIKLSQGTYWRSKIDLNVEHDKIEKPIRPTIRVSTPVYHNEKLYGIVIVNVDLTSLFISIKQSAEFDVYMVDPDGFFLIHPNDKYSWSRYLKTNYKINDTFPSKYLKILEDINYQSIDLNSVSFENIIQNEENIIFILQTHSEYIENLEKNNYTLALYLAILIIFVSIPLGIILSITPAKLQEELNVLLKKNAEQLDIIDKHIVTSKTDLKGNIISVSTAMSKLSGYSKEELIGKNHSILKSGKLSEKLYRTLWETINNGIVWRGEFQNKRKDSSSYWLDSTILPHYDINNKLDSFMAISTDITDKKLIEHISEHDKLTQLYNRTKLDAVLEDEYIRTIRYNNPLSVVLIDLDYFKAVNDNYGHLVGDSVLIEFSNILKNNIRKSDVVGRWGGEEFLIICTETNLDGAKELAESLRKRIEAFDFMTVGYKTASFGVTQFNKDDNIEKLLNRCDDLLYKAKESGRNCVKY